MVHIEFAALVVDDYDAATELVRALGFDLVEDSPSLTNEGVRSAGWSCARLAPQQDS
jgi:hypothetical protein